MTDENPVEDYRVRCATLNPYMDDDDDPTLIDLTERWLIRHIYLLQEEGGTMSLQNVDKVNDYTFLSNFTVSQADNTFRPAYLTEADYEYSKGDPIKITKVGSRLPGNAVSWTNGPPEAADGASRRPDLIDHSGRELR